MKVKVRCQIEPSDYVRAQYLHLRPRPLLKGLGIFLIAITLLVSSQQIFISPGGTSKAASYILLAVLGYLLTIYAIWLPYRTKRIYRQQKGLQEPHDIELTQEELISTSSRGSAKIKWSEFHKYKVGKDMILLYQSDAMFHIFCRRWFIQGDYEKLREILKSALGEPKA